MPKLTVIVTTKNNVYTVRQCLQKILEAPPKNKELVIVYGKSDDGTERIIERYKDKAKILRDDVGTGSAINTGVLNSAGDLIVYVEDHSFIAEDGFLRILKAFESNPDVGYVVFYRYSALGLKKLTSAQKLLNFWRSDIRGSTMGQFRGFRRETFFDVGGFWICPKGADDLEFATRLYDTKWRMMALRSESWDLPRRTLRSILQRQAIVGGFESSWFHVYYDHPFAKREYRVGKNHPFPATALMLKIIFRKVLLSPIHGLRVALRNRYFSYFPFYTMCNWCYAYGFLKGKGKLWGKEMWDPRIRKHKQIPKTIRERSA